MNSRLRSLLVLIRTPEGSPVGPAIARLRLSVALLLLAAGMGVVGYRLIEDFSLFDSLYQTVLTLSTVGFQELRPLSDGARAFTIVLAVLGVGAVLYLATNIATLVLEGDVKRELEAWRVGRHIDDLRQHFVICGAGRVGVEVARAMQQRHEPFVLIEVDPAALDEIAESDPHWLTLHGDASSNDILLRAGIERAAGAVVATRSDAENTFITLSVRSLNPSIYIAARANEPGSAPKLRQAGADRIVSPTEIAGRRLAISVIHPAVAEFTETVLHGTETGEVLAQVDIQFGADIDGASVAEAFSGREHVQILGVRHRDGRLDVAPIGSLPLQAGDSVMVLGTTEAIESLSAAAAAPA